MFHGKFETVFYFIFILFRLKTVIVYKQNVQKLFIIKKYSVRKVFIVFYNFGHNKRLSF